jgi:RNA polymerase sigma factor (sigma-70 family)
MLEIALAPRQTSSRLGARIVAGWNAVGAWLFALAAQQEPPPAVPAAAAGISTSAADPRAAIDRLYQEHARSVLAYLCARLPTLADAEDILADVFLTALRVSAEGQETPGIGWLLTVGRRRVVDFYRQRAHAGARQSPIESAAELPADSQDEPESAALHAEAYRELVALVAQLPEEQRDILALRFGAGMSAPQIAAIVGKSNDATRALLSRAIRALRKEWTS